MNIYVTMVLMFMIECLPWPRFRHAGLVVDVLHTGTYMTHKQLAKTTVVVACLVLACDWTLCVPFVIQVLRVFYSYPSTLHYHYCNCLYMLRPIED